MDCGVEQRKWFSKHRRNAVSPKCRQIEGLTEKLLGKIKRPHR